MPILTVAVHAAGRTPTWANLVHSWLHNYFPSSTGADHKDRTAWDTSPLGARAQLKPEAYDVYLATDSSRGLVTVTDLLNEAGKVLCCVNQPLRMRWNAPAHLELSSCPVEGQARANIAAFNTPGPPPAAPHSPNPLYCTIHFTLGQLPLTTDSVDQKADAQNLCRCKR